MTEFTAKDKREGVERELVFRRRVYPRQIEAGKLKQEFADRQIRLFEEIAEDYRVKEQSERLI